MAENRQTSIVEEAEDVEEVAEAEEAKERVVGGGSVARKEVSRFCMLGEEVGEMPEGLQEASR